MGKFIDRTGQVFGKLTVISEAPHKLDKRGYKRRYWQCICDCGNEVVVRCDGLGTGGTKSCGCYGREMTSNRNFVDIAGQKFGKLTAIEIADRIKVNGKSIIRWRCLCECGEEVIVRRNGLGRDTISCGCYNREKSTKHGAYKTRLYSIWSGIKDRCYNPICNGYKYYGGRGIDVCDEWREDFIAFRDWALANGYQDELTIDRIDVNGNYCPENCRWVTVKEQNRNKTQTIYFQAKTLGEIADLTGLAWATLRARLKSNPNITYEKLTRPLERKERSGNPLV